MNKCYNPFSLDGKRILITGASSGIGKATAIECSRMGATLIITGRNEERLRQTFDALDGDGHKMVIADITDSDSLAYLIRETGLIDGVVISTGIGLMLPLKMAKTNKVKSIFDTNLFAPAELVRLLIKSKLLANASSIVTLASVEGVSHWVQGNGIYGATKAALASWMRTLAVELSPKRIRVNCVCPGMTETPLIHNDGISEEELAMDAENYLMKRYGTPEEIAWSIIYFLSDASKWVTGTNFIIDGGISVNR